MRDLRLHRQREVPALPAGPSMLLVLPERRTQPAASAMPASMALGVGSVGEVALASASGGGCGGTRYCLACGGSIPYR